MRTFFLFVLLGFIATKPLIIIAQSYERFFSGGYEKRYESLKNSYLSSQYVQKENPNIIPDEAFEEYAAGAFLKGLNPILIVHDHPPLGRYILSLSVFVFDNARTITIPLYFLSLLGLYLIAKKAINDSLFSLIPIAFFSNEPLLFNKLIYTPLPEIIQYPFIIFSFYFFLRYLGSSKAVMWAVLTAITLGFVISTRVFVTGGLMMAVMILSLLILRVSLRKLVAFAAFLPLSFVVLWLSYTVSIIQSGNILAPVGIQKYILSYHNSKFILPFSFWDLLLFNRWHTWWGGREILRDASWVFLWPASVLLSFLYFVVFAFKKISLNNTEKVLFLWLIAYSLLLSLGYTSTRYFMPIVPFLYILSTSFIIKIVGIKNER